ncbi:hypothetical protein AVEN_126666-1 [Araneus ventricosus]|uniref:Uncharacterized protein n=1 Tax=Araneus ventricosus TaxID=182803 RepID=A0A4Y2NM36_ARAVE|nr:hypothetical protein AVEN_126666-1 [Araneus ventricosus]
MMEASGKFWKVDAEVESLGNIYTGADISNTKPGGHNGKLVTLALPRHLGFNWMMVVTTAILELGVES